MKKSLFVLLLCFLISIPFISEAQRWKASRQEVFIGLGGANFLGELGGGEGVGRNFLGDFELNSTRPGLAIGYRYRLGEFISARASFAYGRLNGDDKFSEEIYRKNRNLHFRSPVYELAVAGEFYFLKEQTNGSYRLRGVRGKGGLNLSGYAFVGIGGFYFNPQAKYNGKWEDLQPLSTEGQGLEGGPDKYSRISFAIPYGIGFKYVVNRQWSIGLEYGLRKTFTDYIDDVSGVYFDNSVIENEKGEMAADLADPNLGLIGDNGDIGDGIFITDPGQQRGDSTDKDTYMFGMITLSYKLVKLRRNIPKF